VQEALRCLSEGRPRLIYIGPDAPRAGAAPAVPYDSVLGNYCVSGGSALLLLEPMNKPGLLIVGEGRIAQGVEELARVVGYRASRVTRQELRGSAGRAQVAVIATMNAYDEEALEFALRERVKHILLVASMRRWRSMAQALKERGFTEEQLSRIKAPAGLDIGARTPEEIAVSIMAEVISLLNAPGKRKRRALPKGAAAALRDPVCGMLVREDTPYRLTVAERTYYFCSQECLSKFSSSVNSGEGPGSGA